MPSPVNFSTILCFFVRLWASESDPTSKLTFYKSRSRKRRNPPIVFDLPKYTFRLVHPLDTQEVPFFTGQLLPHLLFIFQVRQTNLNFTFSGCSRHEALSGHSRCCIWRFLQHILEHVLQRRLNLLWTGIYARSSIPESLLAPKFLCYSTPFRNRMCMELSMFHFVRFQRFHVSFYRPRELALFSSFRSYFTHI